MSTKSSVWDKILKVIIAVASALIGALERPCHDSVAGFLHF
ncbi:smalltalk protein [Bacteroides uniformis]|nr:smalltalk protein [Bacteroides uniformis]